MHRLFPYMHRILPVFSPYTGIYRTDKMPCTRVFYAVSPVYHFFHCMKHWRMRHFIWSVKCWRIRHFIWSLQRMNRVVPVLSRYIGRYKADKITYSSIFYAIKFGIYQIQGTRTGMRNLRIHFFKYTESMIDLNGKNQNWFFYQFFVHYKFQEQKECYRGQIIKAMALMTPSKWPWYGSIMLLITMWQ